MAYISTTVTPETPMPVLLYLPAIGFPWDAGATLSSAALLSALRIIKMGLQFDSVDCSCGAPMGRPQLNGDRDLNYKVDLFRVDLSNGYDDGGAYWGDGLPLFCARGESNYGGYEFVQYVRAPFIDVARAMVKSTYPKIEFINNDTREILRGMMLAFFACGYADQADNHGQPLCGEIMEQLPPDIDPAADKAARLLWLDISYVNGGDMPTILYRRYPGELSARQWGHYAAMSAMGHGVGLWEYIGEAVAVPNVEFDGQSLQRDYFEDH